MQTYLSQVECIFFYYAEIYYTTFMFIYHNLSKFKRYERLVRTTFVHCVEMRSIYYSTWTASAYTSLNWADAI